MSAIESKEAFSANPELQEEVARAICWANQFCGICGATEIAPSPTCTSWTSYEAEAIAAVAVLRLEQKFGAIWEQAALIADEVSAEYGKRQDKTLSEVQFEGMVACDQVATAIRFRAALKEPSHG